MKSIKRLILGMLSLIRLMLGLAYYVVSKKTLPSAYQGMITLFCMTKGCSNDFLSKAIAVVKGRYDFSNTSGVLGRTKGANFDQAITQLNERGFYVFERRLPDELCDRLLQYSLSHTSKMRPMDGGMLGEVVDAVYDRSEPHAVRYDFSTQDLLDNPDVQSLLADTSFAAIAQSYLGCRPMLDIVTMWWHTSFQDKPDSEAAQYFHFDMDRVKWLKFFIYVTDVDTTSGPHIFVAGSHKTGGIPASLLNKGYSRLSDEEVKVNYSSADLIEFAAPRGTMIAEDTRGLHKGKHVEKGDRLVLQFQFSNSQFGGNYPKNKFGNVLTDNLKDSIAKYPHTYDVFL